LLAVYSGVQGLCCHDVYGSHGIKQHAAVLPPCTVPVLHSHEFQAALILCHASASVRCAFHGALITPFHAAAAHHVFVLPQLPYSTVEVNVLKKASASVC
jgi:hypothetical protein